MAVIIFFIVLGTLVFVHELGHFLAAKKAGVEVEEFGFGYPPRALKIGRKWGTLFSLNWIPFGGFVKILGENYEEDNNPPELAPQKVLGSPNSTPSNSARLFSEQVPAGKNFTQVSKKWQAAILAAGVSFNILFAWLLFSLGFMIGLPTPAENNFGAAVKNPALTIINVVGDSPAETAGLKSGDKIKNILNINGESVGALTPEKVSDFINNSSGEIKVAVLRGENNFDFEITPQGGIEEGRKVIGINTDIVGTLSLPLHKAFYEGGKTTFKLVFLTVGGIFDLIKNAVMGRADVLQVAGPVGIVGLVGDASRLGFAYLLTFSALISVNLAVINLVPFPALDGGRILFVAVEAITKKKINAKFAGIANTVGFALLIVLMLFITYRDILKLF